MVTTPNYYALTRRHVKRWRGWFDGGGITVDEILATPTHGHHWKEYTRSEVERYFRLLSPDFVVHRALCIDDVPAGPTPLARRLAHVLRTCVPLLRERLHVEIDLPAKTRGITSDPQWGRS